MRAFVRRLHLALGIVLCVPMAVLGVTGSILALGDGGTAPAPLAGHAGRERGVDDIVRAAQSAAPPGSRPTLYVAGTRGAPARVAFSPPARVLIDPVSLAVIVPDDRGSGLERFAHDLHANVLAGPVGRQIVGWFGVALLVLALSGPIAWWPGRRRLGEGFAVRRNAGAFRFARDLHRVAGIGTFGLLAVLAVTGTFIVFPDPVGRAIESVVPGRALWRTDAADVRPIAGVRPMSAGDAVVLARTVVGPARVRSIAFARAHQPLRIDLVRAGRGPVTVLVDPWSHRVVDVRDPARFTPGERIVDALRPLHEGQIFGGAWRAALVVIGCCPLFFAITGIAMWTARHRRASV